MQSMTSFELTSLVNFMNRELLGAEFQGIFIDHKKFYLKFWRQEIQTLIVDFSLPSPVMILDKKTRSSVKNKKPLKIFMESHFKGRLVEKVIERKKYGRVIRLYFSEKDFFEIRLFAQGKNILAQLDNGKSVSLFKPLELTEVEDKEVLREKERSPQELLEEWREKQKVQSSQREKKEEGEDKELKKKKKRLEQMKKDFVQRKEDRKLEQLLERLNQVQSWDEEKEKFPEFESSYEWHMALESVYEKVKKKKEKLRRLEGRIAEFEKELKEGNVKKNLKPYQHLKKIKASQGKNQLRKFELSSEVCAYYGKSAKDNVTLIKRSQSWHLWLHIKDRPSSHCIIARPKKRELKPHELQAIGKWFLTETEGGKKSKPLIGKFELMMAEVKALQLIKGDRLGRVHVRAYKSLIVSL